VKLGLRTEFHMKNLNMILKITQAKAASNMSLLTDFVKEKY
jgi:hypothetical protein